jgi:hypothetical protein
VSNPVQSYPTGEPAPQYPGPQYPGQVPGYPVAPEPPKRTNGFAIAALILGIISLFPLGLIFGIIGLVKSKTYRSGKVMSWIAIVLSVLWIIPYAAVTPRILKATDPGCINVVTNVNNLLTKMSGDAGDSTAGLNDLKALVTELKTDAGKSHNADAKNAMTTMANDVQSIIDQVSAGTMPSDAAFTKLDTDTDAINVACGRK